MADLEKEKLSEEDMNKTENSNSVENVLKPEEEYEKALKRRKNYRHGDLFFDCSRDNRCGRPWAENAS